MLQLKTKVIRTATIKLTDTQAQALGIVHEMIKELQDNIEQIDLISPFTGQIFENNTITDGLDLLETIAYYNNTQDEMTRF